MNASFRLRIAGSVTLLLLLVYMITLAHRLPPSISVDNENSVTNDSSAENPPTALVGIFLTARDIRRRTILRYMYRNACPPQIRMRFILGQPLTWEERDLLTLEMKMYDDIMTIPVSENMDYGKTYTFFTHMYDEWRNGRGEEYTFVMKVDSDAFVNCQNLADRLSTLPRENIYYGRIGGGADFYLMYGMGYALSWDIVARIRFSEYAKHNQIGHEDTQVAKWIQDLAWRRVGREPVWIDEYSTFSDVPDGPFGWSKPYSEGEVLMHHCKSDEQILHAFRVYHRDQLESGMVK